MPSSLAACVLLGAVGCVAASLIGCSDDKSSGSSHGGSTSSAEGGAPDSSDGGKGSAMIPNLGELGEEPAAEAAWTVLVYGHGDHNLSNSLLTDLQEMAKAK